MNPAQLPTPEIVEKSLGLVSSVCGDAVGVHYRLASLTAN